jgi:hypothetical protein
MVMAPAPLPPAIGAALDLDAVLADRVRSGQGRCRAFRAALHPTIMVGDGINTLQRWHRPSRDRAWGPRRQRSSGGSRRETSPTASIGSARRS